MTLRSEVHATPDAVCPTCIRATRVQAVFCTIPQLTREAVRAVATATTTAAKSRWWRAICIGRAVDGGGSRERRG